MQVDKRSKYAPLTGNIIIKNLINLLFFFFFLLHCFSSTKEIWCGQSQMNQEQNLLFVASVTLIN